MALLLTVSNMALLGHVTGEAPTDSGSCYLCVLHAGAASAIAPDSTLNLWPPATFKSNQAFTTTPTAAVALRHHQSRAPPSSL